MCTCGLRKCARCSCPCHAVAEQYNNLRAIVGDDGAFRILMAVSS